MKNPVPQHNCFHGIVRGRVQGVGFRVFAREAAYQHKVNGWVRNRPDGTVEIMAEGDEMALTDFLTDLYKGPVLSHVQDIDLDWRDITPAHERFEILR